MRDEEVFGASDTGVGLKRNPAQQAKRLPPTMTTQFEPDHIAQQACGDREASENGQVCFPISCDRPSREQDRNGRNRETNLLCEDGQKHHQLDMMEKKFKRLLHAPIRLCSRKMSASRYCFSALV